MKLYDPRWPHVSIEELRCKHCGVLHGEPHPALLELFEQIRTELGDLPITITDACRCQAREDDLTRRGERTAKLHSPHVTVVTAEFPGGVFTAMDLDADPRKTGWDIADAAYRVMPVAGVGVAAYHGRFCHVDVAHLVRPDIWRSGRRW